MAKRVTDKGLEFVADEVLADAEPLTNAEGDQLLPGMPAPLPLPKLYDFTRTFRTSIPMERLESEALEQGRPARYLGKLSVAFTATEENIAADDHADVSRIGNERLDEQVMTEEEFASMYPGGEVVVTSRTKPSK